MKGGGVREVKCGVGAVMSEGRSQPGLMRRLKKFPTASFETDGVDKHNNDEQKPRYAAIS
jgi:hypothetical protein